jgi:hypothetical protein
MSAVSPLVFPLFSAFSEMNRQDTFSAGTRREQNDREQLRSKARVHLVLVGLIFSGLDRRHRSQRMTGIESKHDRPKL